MPLTPSSLTRGTGHRSSLVKVLENISWLFFDKVLRVGLGMIIGVLIARYLGPEKFGLFSFAAAFVSIFAVIAGMGLKEIVIRDIIRDPGGVNVTLGTAAIMQLVGGIITYSLVIGAIFWIRPEDALARMLVAILGSAILFKSSEIAVYWFDSQVTSKYHVWVSNGSFLIFAIIKIVLVSQNAPLISFAWATMAEALIAAVFMIVMLGLRGQNLKQLQPSFSRMRCLFKDSWPFLLSSITAIIYMRIDLVMLGQMMNDEAVGIYGAAVRVSEVWYFIPTIVVTSVFPMLIKNHSDHPGLFYLRLQQLYGGLVKLAIVVAIIVSLTSAELIKLIFGEAYIEASPILSWHIWSSIFVFYGIVWSRWIALEGLQKTALMIHCMSLLSNIALNIFLIPLYGANGAAMATALSYAMGHTVFMAAFKNQRVAVKMFWLSFWVQKREGH